MNDHAKKLLFDVLDSGQAILDWCSGKTFGDYEADRQLRRAVEREFGIIGEALSRLKQTDAGAAGRISELPRIIAFRNRVIHGYDGVDNATVWGIVQSHLPGLLAEVESMLRAVDEHAG